MIAIKTESLGKKYSLNNPSAPTLRGSIRNWMNITKKRQDFWALQDVNFEIQQGEAVGIIGPNGAGKSTLLKLLSRITTPTTGRAIINGRIASLLEVGTGFHPELTGKENIFLNGTILGMKRNEISQELDAIIDFAGVERYVDQPVKHYSSGMYVRLAFAIAAHLKAEILLIDEVLAVGDISFQQKSLNKMKSIANEGRTIVLVSHNTSHISKLTSRTLLINQGKVTTFNNSQEAINKYIETHERNSSVKLLRKSSQPKFLKINTVIINEHSNKEIFLNFKEGLSIRVVIFSFVTVKNLSLTIEGTNHTGEWTFSAVSSQDNFIFNCIKDKHLVIDAVFEKLEIKPGKYSLHISVAQGKEGRFDNVIIERVLRVGNKTKDGTIYEGYWGAFQVSPKWKQIK